MIKIGIERRKIRNRAKINGSKDCPRISIFKSNKYIYIQAIDDQEAKTLASVSEKSLGNLGKLAKSGTERSLQLGKMLAEKLLILKIKKAVFNKGIYKYHGKIMSIAQGLREGGIKV